MPELPEVETTLRGVSPHLVGHTIRSVVVRDARLRWPIPESIEKLNGQRVTAATRRGKYLLFSTAAGTLMMHLGMSGALRISEPSVPLRKHDHFVLELSTGKQLRYHDPRRFGCALLLEGDPMQHPLLADLGPEPLTEGFTAEYLHTAAKGRSSSVKSFIMDSHIVVGVGNIYACEALFIAGIKPSKPAGKVSLPSWDKLTTAIKEVLAASIEMGGTTLRDFLRENGEPGYFKQTLRVYDREGEPCLTCSTKVKRTVQSQRSTFFCPKCQAK